MRLMKRPQLELYTRPTCSDCQAGKEFLATHNISYTNHDLSKQPEKEKDLRALTGTRIVPAFVFKGNLLRGLFSKQKVLIGFENNIDDIKSLLKLDEPSH